MKFYEPMPPLRRGSGRGSDSSVLTRAEAKRFGVTSPRWGEFRPSRSWRRSYAIAAQADADLAAIAKASLEQYIRPGYAQFAQSTDALKQSVGALCGKPSPAAVKDTQKAFAATVEAWSVVEPIRFGPVAQEHRFERIFYWPDPKGLGTRQIREVLAKQDKSVTEQTGLVGKSVALQGLPALEYLLYGDGAATLEKAAPKGRSAAALPKPSPAISQA